MESYWRGCCQKRNNHCNKTYYKNKRANGFKGFLTWQQGVRGAG